MRGVPGYAHALLLERKGWEANTFTLDSWTDANNLKMRIGSMHGYSLAKAAFAAAVKEWPHSIITARLGAQIMRSYRPGEAEAQAMQAGLFRLLGPR